jgi:hypothetical protein
MIHIRIDDEPENSKRRFLCGIGPELPPGDTYFCAAESMADRADCPGCNPTGPRQYGTPISQLSGRSGQPGFSGFSRIAQSWGYE